MRGVAGALAFACTLGSAALSPSQDGRTQDEAAVRALVARYVAAREALDPAAIGDVLADGVDQLVSSGEWRRGRAGVVSGTLRSSALNPGRRTIAIETVRFISPDVAIVDGRYTIAAQPDGATRRMWTSFVMVRTEDDWRITAIRNMLPTSRRE